MNCIGREQFFLDLETRWEGLAFCPAAKSNYTARASIIFFFFLKYKGEKKAETQTVSAKVHLLEDVPAYCRGVGLGDL